MAWLTRMADAKEPVTALVFKTLSDPHLGKLSLTPYETAELSRQLYVSSRYRCQLREIGGEVGVQELPHPLRLLEVFQLGFSQIAETQPGWKSLPHKVGSDSRDKHLPTVRRGPQSSAVVHRRAVIIAQPQISLARVYGDAHSERFRQRPRFMQQGQLNRTSGCYTIRGAGEHGEAAVALPARPDDLSALLGDELFNQLVVAR